MNFTPATPAPSTNAPITYPNAVTDRQIRPVVATTVPAGVNSTFIEKAFSRTIKRLTNETVGSTKGSSHRMLSSESACAFGCNSDRFVCTTPNGSIEYFTLDGQGNATFIKKLPFTNEPTFSRLRPSIVYGAVGFQVIEYDTNLATSKVLWDLAQFDPSYAISGLYLGGSVQSSASNPERVVVFYGGSGADKHFKVAVFEASNPANIKVYDTMGKTVDGQAVSVDFGYHVHAIGVDKSGQYVLVYPSGTDQSAGAAVSYVWDVINNTIMPNRTYPWGHDATGFGDYINNTGDFGSPYDAFQYAYRKLNALTTPTRVIRPQVTPKLVNSDGHPQWNNARPDTLTPFAESTMRFYEDIPENLETDPTHRTNTTPWREFDNELLSIHPTDGNIYRWCHHFANIYADDGRTMNYSFWYQPIAQVSPNGRWLIWHSNMMKTLGIDPTEPNPSAKYRSDLFLVDTSLPMAGATPNPPIVVNPMAITRNQPFTVTVNSDGVDVTDIELFQDGVSQGTKPFVATGTAFAYTAGLPAGTYIFTAVAKGPGGSSDPSDPITQVIAPGKPHKPSVTVA